MDQSAGGNAKGTVRSRSEAVALARTFQYCPQCAAATGADRDQEAERNFECGVCGYTVYFNPGSAVAAILYAPDGRALFLRRQRDPGMGLLGLPGGFIDPQEPAEVALTREVREETGLIVSDWRYLASFPNIYRYRGIAYDVTDIFFVSAIPGFENIILDTAESSNWTAIKPAEALQLETFAFNSNRLAVEVFVRSA